MSGPPPGWHPDPGGRHHLRYWDGASWTEWVSTSGVTGREPLAVHGRASPAATEGGGAAAEPVLRTVHDGAGSFRIERPDGGAVATATPAGDGAVAVPGIGTLRRVGGSVVVLERGGTEVGRFERAAGQVVRLLGPGAVVGSLHPSGTPGDWQLYDGDAAAVGRLTRWGASTVLERQVPQPEPLATLALVAGLALMADPLAPACSSSAG